MEEMKENRALGGKGRETVEGRDTQIIHHGGRSSRKRRRMAGRHTGCKGRRNYRRRN